VRLIVEREREIEKFNTKSSFRITALFDVKGKTLSAELPKKFDNQQEAEDFLKKCIGVDFTIENLEKKPGKKSPAAPFTTSTLQQEASRKLGFSVAQTMSVAQKLYEAGKITYMRTDSVNLSDDAMTAAKNEINFAYGSDFHQSRKYTTKSEGAQEAHEAIRPTDFSKHDTSGERNEQRLYELIWKRAIASQMSDAQLEKTVATIKISTTPEKLIASGEVIKFEGFLKVYLEDTDDEPDDEENGNKGLLPPLSIGEMLNLLELKGKETFTRPAPRYTEASLVKKLEEMGIGRPSTYAPTLETLEKRGYMVRKGRTLLPTPLGRQVTHYLKERFPQVVAYEFTARMEDRLDEVEEGKAPWPKVVWEFYEPFLGELAQVPKKTCPRCGRPLELKVSRYGQFLGCTGYPECTYTEPLEKKKEAEPIGEACPKCGRPLVRKEGRYGSFIACSGYPECDYTRDDGEPTGHACPKCGSRVLEKRSRRGKPYYKCENNACDFLSFYPLLEQTCPSCGWPLVKKGEGACINPACPAHDPKLVPSPK
ncbi:MAG: DNA topoisomerase, partial [Anaerolineales bacterium]